MSQISFTRSAIGAIATAAALAAGPAIAANVSFVSQTGVNAGDCSSPAAPCRTFNFAVAKTNAGGEVKALTPGFYGRVEITKAITITGVEGAEILLNLAQSAIRIDAGANDAINIVGLALDGFNGTALRGIEFSNGGSLTVKNCTIRNFLNFGISIITANAAKFVIEDTSVTKTLVSDNIIINAASATGVLNRVSSTNGLNGLRVFGGNVAIFDSVFSGHTGSGVLNGNGPGSPAGTIRVARSTLTRNAGGLNNSVATALVETSGKNFIRGNGTNLVGTIANVGTQ